MITISILEQDNPKMVKIREIENTIVLAICDAQDGLQRDEIALSPDDAREIGNWLLYMHERASER